MFLRLLEKSFVFCSMICFVSTLLRIGSLGKVQDCCYSHLIDGNGMCICGEGSDKCRGLQSDDLGMMQRFPMFQCQMRDH